MGNRGHDALKPVFRALKLEDPSELRRLVAEQAEGVEPGLKVLDLNVRLGEATVDLVALDARETLTLVLLGLLADDALMLRALDAYSWCVDHPQAFRRLYPMARLGPDELPRVIFVADEVPDAFQRKIRHLRFSRVDCLGFRFGLEFRPVKELSGGEPGTGEDPVPAPREPTPASLLEGLRLPEDGHLSPQWRRVLGARPEEVDPARVRAVREYLQREFPTLSLYDFHAHERGVWVFQLQDNQGVLVHTAALAEDLLDGLSESQLQVFLDKHKLVRVLRQAGQAVVSITRSGLKIERP